MKLDLTRYEGHSENPYALSGWFPLDDADVALVEDAPLLLARVVELEAAKAAMLADIFTCTAILDADKSHSLTMCDDCWRLLEKYIPEDES